VQTHTETTPTPNNQLNTSTTTTTNKLATLKPVSTSITLMLAKRDGMPVGNSNGQQSAASTTASENSKKKQIYCQICRQ
jgi:hypothetical protein